MRILVLANGSIPNEVIIQKELMNTQTVICADGGALIAKRFGIIPQYIVGDLDSIPDDILSYYQKTNVTILRYPKEKDETDTHIAVDTALSIGADEICILGGIGNRIDHSFGNILLLIKIAKKGVRGKIIDSSNEIYVSNTTFQIKGKPGDILSILPLGENVLIHETEGLYYPIAHRILPIDYPYGVSNVFTNHCATIRIETGWAMIIKSKD